MLGFVICHFRCRVCVHESHTAGIVREWRWCFVSVPWSATHTYTSVLGSIVRKHGTSKTVIPRVCQYAQNVCPSEIPFIIQELAN
jgi:hypothetical protein